MCSNIAEVINIFFLVIVNSKYFFSFLRGKNVKVDVCTTETVLYNEKNIERKIIMTHDHMPTYPNELNKKKNVFW